MSDKMNTIKKGITPRGVLRCFRQPFYMTYLITY
jgi:hypothetical protein